MLKQVFVVDQVCPVRQFGQLTPSNILFGLRPGFNCEDNKKTTKKRKRNIKTRELPMGVKQAKRES